VSRAKEGEPRCPAVTAKGTRCTHKAETEGGYCRWHDPESSYASELGNRSQVVRRKAHAIVKQTAERKPVVTDNAALLEAARVLSEALVYGPDPLDPYPLDYKLGVLLVLSRTTELDPEKWRSALRMRLPYASVDELLVAMKEAEERLVAHVERLEAATAL
jgi:hypothetical protein